MPHMEQPVISLLRRCGMYPEDIDLTTMTNVFLGQMRISFYGGDSSIPVRPTYLTSAGQLTAGQAIAVAMVDERQVQTAKVSFSDTGYDLEPGESFPVPGADYPAPFEDLIFAVAELIEPLLANCKQIAFCLNFPLMRLANGDCVISALPPGFQLSGWEEQALAAALLGQLAERGLSDQRVLPVSADAATLLGGVANQRAPGRYLGFHWEQGLSCAFAAPESAVVKLKSGKNQLMLFDVASGSLTGVPFGAIDLTMDRDSQHPGHGLLDKMVSTRHLGDLYRFTMIKAVEANLLTFMCGREFLSLRKLDLSTVLRFLDDPEGDNLLANFCRSEAQDRKIALTVAHAVLDRAAKLACANLTAVLSLVSAGRDPAAPTYVSVSGGAFDIPVLLHKLEDHLKQYTAGSQGIHCRLHHNEHATIVGTAAAILLNQDKLQALPS